MYKRLSRLNPRNKINKFLMVPVEEGFVPGVESIGPFTVVSVGPYALHVDAVKKLAWKWF